MKRFLTYTVILLALLITLMGFLDISYTYIYNHGAPRNKVMWVRSMTNLDSIDYIILGSSRANQHINPAIINTQTGLYGINLGAEAFTGFEMYLLLEEFLKRQSPKTIFVQVDSQYLYSYPDKIAEKSWLPYIQETAIYSEFRSYGEKYAYYKYIPFYRYAKFQSRIGYRDIVTSMLGKGQPYTLNLGYSPQHQILKKEKPYIADKTIKERNIYFDKIITLCKEKGIKVYFFTAPIYKFEGDLSFLRNNLPNYIDFKDTIQQKKLFADQVHLNSEGAKKFTNIFVNTYFIEK